MYIYLKKINYSYCFAIALIFTINNIEAAANIMPPPPQALGMLPLLTYNHLSSLNERFFTAVHNDAHISEIKEYIKQGANVNCNGIPNIPEKPLFAAIKNYNLGTVQELVNSGAEISDFFMKHLENMKRIENERTNKLELKKKRLEIIKFLENERAKRKKKKQECQEIITNQILNVPHIPLFMDIIRIISEYTLNTDMTDFELFEFEKLNKNILDTLITQNKLKREHNNTGESNGTKKAKLSSEAIASLISKLEEDTEILNKKRAECKNFEESLELEAKIEKNQKEIESLKN